METVPRICCLGFVFLLSCSESAAVDAAPEPAPVKLRRTFAAAVEGGLALLDVDDGHVVAKAPGGVVDDVVVDRARGRLITFEIEPDEEGGAIVGRPIDSINDRTLLGSSAGVLRFAVTDHHVLVFEDAYGPRWRALDGRTSVFAPTPRSAWARGKRLHALTWEPDGRWAERSVSIDGPDLGTIELGSAPPLSSSSPRMVSVDGRAVALDVASGKLSLDGVDTGLAAAAVVDACPLSEHAFALLASGPTRLVVGALGGPYASLAIEGQPRFDPRYLSRSIVPVSSSRVLVAVTDRVFAVHVRNGASPSLSIDEHFAAQGAHAPIDGLLP